MKILLDTRWLKRKPTGVGWYISELAHQFSKISTDEFTLLGGESKNLPQQLPRIPLSIIKKKVYQGLWKRVYWPKLDHLAGKQDVVHFMNGTAIPHSYPVNVLTVHDLTYIEHPEMIEAGNLVFLEKIMPWSIKQASHIIAVSEDTKADLHRYFNVPLERISVIYNGVDPIFLIPSEADEIANVQKKYKLPQKFFLSVSTIEPRKDYTTLIEAYNLLPEEIKKEFSLIIVGSKGWQNEYKKVTDLIHKLKLKNKVQLLGYVDYTDLPIIYKLAEIYLHTSIKEGFGIGLVQAMATHLPIIVSNTSCHPEIVKNAGLYFEPKNSEDLADKILQMLDRKSTRQYHVTIGAKLIEQYSWKKAALETLNIYHNLFNNISSQSVNNDIQSIKAP